MGVLIPILSTIQKVHKEKRAIYVKAELKYIELKYSKKCILQLPISTN